VTMARSSAWGLCRSIGPSVARVGEARAAAVRGLAGAQPGFAPPGRAWRRAAGAHRRVRCLFREVTLPPSDVGMFPFQWTAKLAMRTATARELSGWAALYGGYARGTLGPRWGFFWGIGGEGAGDPFCPYSTCAILNVGVSVRVGIAFREMLDGNSYQGKYVYLAATPYYAYGGGDIDDLSRRGVRFALGFVNPLRLRMVDYFSEKEPNGGMWFFQMLNSLELVFERCSGGAAYCPRRGAGLLVGFGF
jgi:hypothetical protein